MTTIIFVRCLTGSLPTAEPQIFRVDIRKWSSLQRAEDAPQPDDWPKFGLVMYHCATPNITTFFSFYYE
jgi:hypothetical protein